MSRIVFSLIFYVFTVCGFSQIHYDPGLGWISGDSIYLGRHDALTIIHFNTKTNSIITNLDSTSYNIVFSNKKLLKFDLHYHSSELNRLDTINFDLKINNHGVEGFYYKDDKKYVIYLRYGAITYCCVKHFDSMGLSKHCASKEDDEVFKINECGTPKPIPGDD